MNRSRKFSVSDQLMGVKVKYPDLNSRIDNGGLIVQGDIRPTPRSVDYCFKIRYKLNQRPKVDILSPKLTQNFKGDKIPHIYERNELCLYYPKYKEFDSTKLISETIIPWTVLWLYHYENWHITGTWEGGGIHLKT